MMSSSTWTVDFYRSAMRSIFEIEILFLSSFGSILPAILSRPLTRALFFLLPVGKPYSQHLVQVSSHFPSEISLPLNSASSTFKHIYVTAKSCSFASSSLDCFGMFYRFAL